MTGPHALPWAVGPPSAAFPDEDFFARPVLEVARDLLGARLESTVGGERAVVVIVETEAYQGPGDPASHAATRQGVTRRNRAMFGPPGRAYIYRSYGVHWCFNVVTGGEGSGEAVLVRGAEVLEGVDVVRRRRGRSPLAAGPGRLCEALAVTDALYGHPLDQPPVRMLGGWSVPEALVARSGRVGVREAADWPFRFYVRGSAGVSRARFGHESPEEKG